MKPKKIDLNIKPKQIRFKQKRSSIPNHNDRITKLKALINHSKKNHFNPLLIYEYTEQLEELLRNNRKPTFIIKPKIKSKIIPTTEGFKFNNEKEE